MKSEIELTKFKGADVFTIWEVDENGERKKFPIISFGKKKGEAIVKHLKELKDFVGILTVDDIPFDDPSQDYNHPSHKMHY
jgi:hypothetical protein